MLYGLWTQIDSSGTSHGADEGPRERSDDSVNPILFSYLLDVFNIFSLFLIIFLPSACSIPGHKFQKHIIFICYNQWYMLYEIWPTGLAHRLATRLILERPCKEINRQCKLQLDAQYLSLGGTIYVMNWMEESALYCSTIHLWSDRTS